MAARSAGILLFRKHDIQLQVLLVHPGGPFWAKKDDGAWQIPKGGYEEGEQPFEAALRELEEEIGLSLEDPELIDLGDLKQKGGKLVQVWATEQDFDIRTLRSQTFPQEWPPRSGRMAEFPEVDRAAWFSIQTAKRKILSSQSPFLDRLLQMLET